MRYQLEFKNGHTSDALRTLVDESIARLDRLAAGFRPDALFLRIVIQRNNTRRLHRVSLKLDVPRRVLAVEEEQRQPEVAIRAAFAELERRLVRARAKLRPQDSRHPVRVPAAARAQAAESRANGRLRRDALHALEEQRQPLQDFVRRELAYHASMGELPPGRLSVNDVIEAVVQRAEQERTDSRRDARGWLTGLALNVVDAALAQGRGRGRAVPSPEEILERADMHDDITRTLGTLPRAWRRVFVLHAVEGLTLREVARILGRSRASVDADLNHAREFLRQRLVDAGFAADERRTQAFFATVPQRPS